MRFKNFIYPPECLSEYKWEWNHTDVIDFYFTALYLIVSLNSCVSSVTSSEKVDKAQRYADFTLLSVPYPGETPSFEPSSLYCKEKYVDERSICVIESFSV